MNKTKIFHKNQNIIFSSHLTQQVDNRNICYLLFSLEIFRMAAWQICKKTLIDKCAISRIKLFSILQSSFNIKFYFNFPNLILGDWHFDDSVLFSRHCHLKNVKNDVASMWNQNQPKIIFDI